MAAVLASGSGALLSHNSAAALWDMLRTSTPVVHVMAIRSSTAGRSGIATHRVGELHPEDCASRDGIPVTSVARTLLDLASVVFPRQLARAVEQAELLGLFDLRELERLEARSPRRRGWPLLRALLADYRDPPPTRSELERRFLDLCREGGLPPPATNILIAGFEVDAIWHDRRLVVELDGHDFHRTRAAFERDRVRDATLQLEGYRVLRFTFRRLEREPGVVLATIRALLGSGTGRLDIAALDT